MRSAIWLVRSVSGVKPPASVVPTSVIAWMLVIAAATHLLGFQRYTPGSAEAPPVDVHASCAPEANAEVNRGAGFLHLASTARARLAFDRAAAIDPDCAMAFWGRATSFLPATDEPVTSEAIAAGRDGWERACALTAKTDWERGYLDALTSLYEPGRNAPLAVRVRDYAQRLGLLSKAHPDDDGVAVAWMRAVLLQSSLPDDELRRLVRRVVAERFAGRSLTPGAAVGT